MNNDERKTKWTPGWDSEPAGLSMRNVIWILREGPEDMYMNGLCIGTRIWRRKFMVCVVLGDLEGLACYRRRQGSDNGDLQVDGAEGLLMKLL